MKEEPVTTGPAVGCACGKDDCDYCGPAFMPPVPLFVSEEAILLMELHSVNNRRKWNAERDW